MSDKIKVYELAKTLGVKSVFLMDKIRKEWNLPVKSHMETLSLDLVKQIEQKFSKEKKAKVTQTKKKKIVKKVVDKEVKSSVKTKSLSTDTADANVKTTEESVVKPKVAKSRIIRRRKEDQKEIQPVILDKSPDGQDLLSQNEGDISQGIGQQTPKNISDLISVKKSDLLKIFS